MCRGHWKLHRKYIGLFDIGLCDIDLTSLVTCRATTDKTLVMNVTSSSCSDSQEKTRISRMKKSIPQHSNEPHMWVYYDTFFSTFSFT